MLIFLSSGMLNICLGSSLGCQNTLNCGQIEITFHRQRQTAAVVMCVYKYIICCWLSRLLSSRLTFKANNTLFADFQTSPFLSATFSKSDFGLIYMNFFKIVSPALILYLRRKCAHFNSLMDRNFLEVRVI